MTALNATPFFQHFLYSGIAIGINSAATVKIVQQAVDLFFRQVKIAPGDFVPEQVDYLLITSRGIRITRIVDNVNNNVPN